MTTTNTNTNTDAPEVYTYTVEASAGRLGDLQRKLAKLNAQADKCGVKLTIVGPKVVPSKWATFGRHAFMTEADPDTDASYVFARYRYTVSHAGAIVPDGVRLASVVTRDAGVTTANSFDHATPEAKSKAHELRTAKRFECDHCGTSRNRKRALIFDTPDGVKVIGGNCAADFFPMSALSLGTVVKLAALDDFDGPGRSRPRYETAAVLRIAAVLAACYPYGKAGSESPTRAAWWLLGQQPVDSRGVKAREYLLADIASKLGDDWRSRDWAAEVDDIRSWATDELAAHSEFDFNMRAVAEADDIDDKRLGVAIYLPFAYRRAKAKAIERAKREAAPKPETHLGEVGKPVTIDATVKVAKGFDSFYGSGTFYVLTCDDGAEVSYSGTADLGQVGDRVHLTATVKQHDSSKWGATTKVARPRKVTIDR